ncbi:hypothetical protein [Dactylosporangium matsuzakiense]|uniref:Uncharacterized protein n=1 Tax=Dactylosporangium matsuzakiense TaxID=53360 RepID=A0A9W6NND2_9ACTN|nr:hypothetical protein [Dactylosporangium matsuzakiense]UWZ42683.1 hypothetical protein Dmats_34855 [Dactylosporangium matsuzakiense]GLL03835.1 hypothetical protein GCM10017581_055810 [Dactylosporangium matsuzakiense]
MAAWTIADAWVFTAIEGTGPHDGHPLTRIVAKADAINHAVLLESEFVRAVPRLVAAGLIEAAPAADRYWHTETGRALYDRWITRGGLFAWSTVIPPALEQLGPPQDPAAGWSLPAGAFQRAVQAHLRG